MSLSVARYKLLFQATVTVALLAWLIGRLEWRDLLRAMLAAQPGWLALALALYVANLMVSAVRGRAIMRSLARPMPLPLLLRLNWVGAFFNQVLPGAVSGDAVRAYYSRPYAGTLTTALAAVFGERLIGLGVLVLLALGACLLNGAAMAGLPHVLWVLGLAASGYLLGLGLLLASGGDGLLRRLGRVGEKLREARLALRALFRHGPDLFQVLLLSLVVQVLSLFMFWAVGRALGLQLGMAAVWIIWPLVTLLTILPVSLAGWGVREGLLVFYLAYVGVAADQALALSVLTGVVVLLASLPGGLLWLSLGGGLKDVLADKA
ncbi:lysylphosphatidylglycerol synthase transmembrane domain-containing protein [Thermithiobacillus tepidarius DSM 3134]|uniref:lysylphosphatidylglycerol synthase transmembrane domain-containing protein n=1 Tax=Thermithiobacillus tepidarius TaxID=929 RepID=UPI0003FF91E9|nr:lysylphosphatidylglycerol synthase transmembrane domain-containing protein [Thermithiobacillus tepidarius]